MTVTLTISDADRLEVSQALLGPVRQLAREQAAAEADADSAADAAESTSWFEGIDEGDARRFGRAQALIRLSRKAAGLPTDDDHGDWRRLVDTERDAIDARSEAA